MDRCTVHEWQSRGELSVCMSCGAAVDRLPEALHTNAKQRRAAAMRRHKQQQLLARGHVTEVIYLGRKST